MNTDSQGQKKKNCVVWVRAEKTLGRVGRYFFFTFFLQWLTKFRNGYSVLTYFVNHTLYLTT